MRFSFELAGHLLNADFLVFPASLQNLFVKTKAKQTARE